VLLLPPCSVASKGEPFLSGLPSDPLALAAYLASIPGQEQAPGKAAAGAMGSLGDGQGGGSRLRLVQHLAPEQMCRQQLPHERWDAARPPILSFYSFAALERA